MAERRWRQGGRGLALLLLLLTSCFQFHQLARDARFSPDEAFFMTFARGAAVNGDWLLPGALDKPPLSIYVSALSMTAVAVVADANDVLQLDPHLGEFASRLPNLYLALLLTALMMRLAWRVSRCRWSALLAGLLTATSPYLLAYGASAFTDMSLLFWSTLSLYCALTGRWAIAGLALGLAFWSKQQAALLLPPLVLMLVARGGRRDWLRLGLTLASFGAALLLWDGARAEVSIFAQAAANNQPQSWLVEPSLWLGRLSGWLGRGLWLLGPPLLTSVLLLGAAFAAGSRTSLGAAGKRARLIEGALLLTVISYLGAHVVFPFRLYDRYLLLVLPPLILLVASRLARLPQAGALGAGLRLGLAALMLAGGLWSLNADTAIGRERGAYAGIDALARHLNAKPVATVIYNPWLGWELAYYLGQWQDKRTVHFPTAEALVAGALALDEAGDRYFVAALDQPHQSWLAALRAAGFGLALDYQRDRFIVYRLTAPAN